MLKSRNLAALALLGFLVGGSAMVLLAPQAKDEPVIVKSKNDFATTVEKLKKAITSRGLAIVFEANHRNMMMMVGIESPNSVTIGFARPQMGAQVLSVEPRAAIEMPLRVAVRELGPNNVVVIYYKPSYLFGHYGNAKLLQMAKQKMDPMVAAIVKAATQ